MTADLAIRDLSKSFGGVRALADLNLDVEKGEILGIMGANGAGKTTLFGLIAGHVKPSAGEIRFEGRSVVGFRPDRICRMGLCRTFQIVRPFAGLSVLENATVAARFGAGRIAGRSPEERALDALKDVGLAGRAGDPAYALTLAGQKKLEVARALATGARLLLLDEIMAGLTPSEVVNMVEVVRTIHRERRLTLMIIEHVMRALMQVSDRILVLHHGEAIALGTPEEVTRDPLVLQSYLGHAS